MIQVLLPGVFFGNWQLGDWKLLLQIFHRPLWQKSLENSLLLGVGTTLLGTLLGAALAAIRSSWSFPTAKLLDASVWLLLITPSFILAQGWVLFASGGGIAVQLFGWDWVKNAIFTPAGLIFMMTLSKFPFAYLSVHAALEWKVDQLSQAARLCGASAWTTWRTIHAPLLLPALLAGAALVFMDTIGDFGMPASIAAVYRFPTLPYSIYSAIYTSPIRFDMAGVLSFYLVALIGLAMMLQFYALKRSRYDFLTARASRSVPQSAGRFTPLLTALNLLFLLLVIGVPVGSNIVSSLLKTQGGGVTTDNLTLEHYRSLFSSASNLLTGLWHSLAIAGAAAILGLLIGLGVAYVLTYSRFQFKRSIEVFSIITLAVPGVVLGIGYIFVWNQKWLEPLGLLLYGTPWILVLAAIAGAIPVITRLMTGAMAKVPGNLLSAAQLQGDSFLNRMRYILLPLIRGALLSAGLAAFGASIFDLAVSSILFPPKFVTLPVAINKAFEDLNFGYASAATVTSSLIVILIILAIELLLRRKEASS
ncbi:iron ABC transporter permease [Paenibacillus sp. 1011MAR3C5]|uniref:ABC transporter permease n=1 Tax=Paenibacillus sp. 1011MAR3C5 TaxID=1675787 RepID=UPI002175FE09|nr:ABC transporter permease subunit [Paenibacillus sp. 1011MAR3C5]